jgi:dephospho-CoA kinase
MTFALGLTGGIGSGKSTVSRLFRELGARIIDADAIVHELQAPGAPMLDEIAKAFGAHVIDADGALDRAAVGDIVFRDPDARKQLGLIVHGPVGLEMLRQVTQARESRVPLVIADIPLLLEGARAGRDTAKILQLDAVAVVWVPESAQIERTVARDGCTVDEAQRRVDSQLPIDEKKQLADYVIDNSGTPEETAAQTERLYHQLIATAGSSD